MKREERTRISEPGLDHFKEVPAAVAHFGEEAEHGVSQGGYEGDARVLEAEGEPEVVLEPQVAVAFQLAFADLNRTGQRRERRQAHAPTLFKGACLLGCHG
jgi:hypothetical protein